MRLLNQRQPCPWLTRHFYQLVDMKVADKREKKREMVKKGKKKKLKVLRLNRFENAKNRRFYGALIFYGNCKKQIALDA